VSAPRYRYHLNVRAALVLTGIGLVAALGLRLLWGYQEDRILRNGLGQAKAFRDAAREEKDPQQRSRSYELALRHLNQYLAYRADDPEALEIQAQLVAGGAKNADDLYVSAQIYEHLLRVAPDGRRAQDARRRLAELYISYSDLYRSSPNARLYPEETGKNLRYYAAELRTDQLLDPRARPRVDDAEAHRLRGMALEGQIFAGQTIRNVAGKPSIDLLQGAIEEYEAALKRDPGDLVAAQHLAGLFQQSRKDTAAALRVLDGLVKARPDSVEVRLYRHNFFKFIGNERAAADEMKEAVRLAPDNLLVILMAAEGALNGVAKDTAEARRWLDKIPETARNDLRVIKMRGIVAYSEGHTAEAIEIWRKGLELVNGSDPDLHWQLANALLELGRDDEARSEVVQYQRFVDANDPILRFLQAIQDEHAGQYSRATERLESLRDQRGLENRQPMIRLALGRCQEKQGYRDDAEATYRSALQIAPNLLILRLSIIRILLATRPDEAVKEIEEGLAISPNNPALLVTLAEARLREQTTRPPNRRNWASFEAAFQRAAAAAPQSPAIDLVRAERVALDGAIDQAVTHLREAVRKAPRDAAVAIALANGLILKGDLEQALRGLEQAAAPEAAGDGGLLRNERARVMVAMGRGREARAVLVRDVNRLPEADRVEVWKTLVLLCKNQGDRDTARAVFEEWARLLPNDERPKLALLGLDIQADDEQAIGASLEALRPPPDRDNDPTWRMAQAAERLWRRSREKDDGTRSERLKEADELVDGVLRDTKNLNPTALLFKGQILEAKGDRQKAVDAYERSWKYGNPEALQRYVELLTLLDRKDELEHLRKSYNTNQIDQMEALTFFRRGDKNESLRVVEQSLNAKTPAQPWQLEMFNLLGAPEKVESELRKTAEKQPGQLEPWLALVRFQAAHGRPQAAAETIALIKTHVKTDRGDLLEAQCRWAAADRDPADRAFDAALKRTPDDRDVVLTATRYYEETGQTDRAEACLKQVVDRNPNDRDAVRQLAVLLSVKADRRESWDQALAMLGPEGPATSTPEERLARGVVLARSADAVQRKRATDLLESLVADLPAAHNVAVAARDMLARLLIATGEPERASRIAAVSAKMGTSAAAIALYAEALLQSKQFVAVEDQLNLLAKSGQGAAYEANLRARLIQERSQTKEGAAALEKTYLERESTSTAEVFGREAFRMLLAMGTDAGPFALRVGQRLAGHNPSLSWMPAMVLASQGKNGEALILCQKAVATGNDLAGLRQACRTALEVAVESRDDPGTLNTTNAILDAALKHAPENDEFLVMKAILSHLQLRFDEEVRLYRIVLAHQSQDTVVMNNMAWALSEGLNQPSEALELIDKLIKVAGRNGEYLDTRGMILLRLGRLQESVEDLEAAVKAEPNGTRYYHLALGYKRMGRDAESRKALKEAQRAGLTAAMLDPIERAEFESLIKL
jgi:tetratricopeptide (TPR) repeat protein